MTKQEKALYKSGRKNKSGYSKFKITKGDKIKLLVILVFIILSLIITILEIFGVTSWKKLNYQMGTNGGVSPSNSDFSVYYLDVGQSDCSIVVSNGEVMVVDTGSYPRFNHIVEVLYSLNIEKIDYLVISHPHDDHFSGAERLLDKFEICNIIMPTVSYQHNVDNETFTRLLNTVAKKSVNAISAQTIDSFKLGDANVSLLAPLKSYKDLNNMSIVLKVNYGETSFLFQGDAEEIVEKDLLNCGANLKSNVLKVGHHGSKTSTTEAYLKSVNPDIAIISCGEENTHGHPRVTVIENLKKYGVDFYITADNGDIVVESDGIEIKVNCYK